MLKPDWHGVRAAGRVERHVAVLREIAHEISPDPERTDAPSSGDEAHERLCELVARLQEEAPRAGLGASDGHFIDHVGGVAARYGRNLFYCFDDERIPSTTNGLEGFFGASKDQLRRALGTAKTTNGVAQNLGANYLIAFARTRAISRDELHQAVANITHDDYEIARQRLDAVEEPARLRRSRKRNPGCHLRDLLARWDASP